MPHPSEEEVITEIIAEFSELFAFARTRWTRYAAEVHSEMRGVSMMVLQLILRKGPITATELGQILDMDKASISRQATKLRELELICATPSEQDRRVFLLTGTPKAEQLLDRLRDQTSLEYSERFAGWNAGELESLRAALRRFNSATPDRTGSISTAG